MKFRLAIQKPKPKLIGIVEVDIDKNGVAYAYGEDASIGKQMDYTRIMTISGNGIHLSGLEPRGVDKQFLPKYTYQEWWLMHIS